MDKDFWIRDVIAGKVFTAHAQADRTAYTLTANAMRAITYTNVYGEYLLPGPAACPSLLARASRAMDTRLVLFELPMNWLAS